MPRGRKPQVSGATSMTAWGAKVWGSKAGACGRSLQKVTEIVAWPGRTQRPASHTCPYERNRMQSMRDGS